MSTTKSVSAVLLGHNDKVAYRALYESLKAQTRPPDEFILCGCCMDIQDLPAKARITDDHVDDIGQRFCDWGLRLSDTDYVFFASSDDVYEPEWLDNLLSNAGADLLLGAFDSHLVGEVAESKPVIGQVTRGSFLVKTDIAKRVGYNGREYSSDGQFIQDLINNGATWRSVPGVYYYHK